ncbi:MAG: hypothetical protein IKK14_01000, partial [Oscillospiraceae bacterium]|nr:hypothetical protein [Oscillospiraceae bacterium]
EMIGAAAEKHARQHAIDGSDPIDPANIGAAYAGHTHGNIDNSGRIGNTNGMVLMTGLAGKIEAKEKKNSGFCVLPETKQIAGSFIAEDNVEYDGTGISDFVIQCDAAHLAKCHGWIKFGVVGDIEMKGFDFIEDPEEIATATAGSRWEFDLERGCLIVRKRSE